jgi:hypothetical protein
MPRPIKILEPTKPYNMLIKVSQFEKLTVIAEHMQKTSLEQVAVADIIRDAIDVYLSAIEEEDEN